MARHKTGNFHKRIGDWEVGATKVACRKLLFLNKRHPKLLILSSMGKDFFQIVCPVSDSLYSP